MDSLPDFAGMTKNGDSDGAQARSVGPESGPQGLLWPQVKNTCVIRGDSDGAPITTHCHAIEGRHPMAVSDPMPKRPMDSLPYFAGMTKNGDSDGAQARSVGPESGPQGL